MPDKSERVDLEKVDLNYGIAALRVKEPAFTKRFNYYDGNQELRYSTERLRDAFKKIDVYFAENWTAVICNAAIERIGLQGWTVEAEDAQKRLREEWARMKLQLDAQDTSEAAVICGEAFMIADRDETLDLFYNDPRFCHLFYEAGNPKKKRVGFKLWQGDDKRYRADLYYIDHISHYITDEKEKQPKDARGFYLDEQESGDNPFKEIPMFHFRLHRRKIVGDLSRDILSLQDALNKLLADLMASSEFDTFKERVFITNQSVKSLKRAPGMRTRLRPAPTGVQATSVQEFGGSDLGQFIPALERMASSMAIISRTPSHYMFKTGGGLSGDALIAMEAPLVAKAQTYRESLGTTWQEIGAFIARENGSAIPPEAINPSWKPAETVQPGARATTYQAYAATLPETSALRLAGFDEDTIKKVEKELKARDEITSQEAKLELEKIRAAQEAQDQANGVPQPGQEKPTAGAVPQELKK